jgi:hypothetical protein
MSHVVEKWARTNGYKMMQCGSAKQEHTPLCKEFDRGSTSIRVLFSAYDNLIKLDVINYSGWRIPTDAADALRKELESVFGRNSVKEL